MRAIGVAASVAVISAVVVGIPALPGVPQPRHAAAVPAQGRMCSGVQVSGQFTASMQNFQYKLFVPASATVSVTGSIDVFKTSQNGGNFTVSGAGLGILAQAISVSPGTMGKQVSGSKTNTSSTKTFVIDVNNAYITSGAWRFTATVSSGQPAPPCTPMNPAATYGGDNCTAPHDQNVQGSYGDPVNAATGNFYENFSDFDVPSRGPGLNLTHTYNSRAAAVDSPLGFGWAFSYATSLAITPTVVTVKQEGGAEVPFYVSGTTYEAPPWAVATLVKNADGSYTYNRCNDTVMRFTASGQLSSIADLDGHMTTLEYTSGRLSTVTDRAANRHLTFTWNGTRIASVSDDGGRSVTFGYNDGAGNLTDYTDTAGATWRFTYNSLHQLETMRRPTQQGVASPAVVTNVYDAQGRVLSQTDELNRKTEFDYTTVAGATLIKDPKGNVVREDYKNLVRTALWLGYNTADPLKWAFEADGSLGITKVTDPLGRVTHATYDLNGNLLSHRDPLNRLTLATYSNLDKPLTVTDPKGVTTTYTYNAEGHVKTVTTPFSPAPREIIYEYDLTAERRGDLTKVTDPNKEDWTFEYDAAGNLVRSSDPLGNATRYGYDTATGWLTSQVTPRGVAQGVAPGCTPPAFGCTTYEYNGRGQVKKVTDANGHTRQSSYNPAGQIEYEVDGEHNRTDYRYDAAGQLRFIDRPGGTTLETTYWPDGAVMDQIDGADHATRYDYDPYGRLKTVTDPDTRVTTYGYDRAGNPVSKADPGGTCPAWQPTGWPPALAPTAKCTVMTYDAADQLKTVTYSDGVTPNVTDVTYDPNGRRTSLKTADAPATTWKWDNLGRLELAGGPNGTVAYEYASLRDPATKVTYAGSRVVQRRFDRAGRLDQVTDWLNNITTITPDPDSNVGAVTPPAATGLSDTFGYDGAGQLSTVTAKSGASTVAGFTYGRDGNGGVETVTTTGTAGLSDTHSYTYTLLSQLETVDGATTWSYDDADNLTASGATILSDYDAANQVGKMTRGGVATTFSYDDRGNRTSASPSVGVGMAYGYDQANRLTSVDPSSFSSGLGAGWYHSLAAKSDGTAWAWGYNSNGQLGDGTTTSRSTPVQVSGLTGVVAVSASYLHSVALKADGTVWAWGYNGNGELGDGTTTDRSTPVRVVGLSDVTAIATGAAHSMALRADGTVWAWGGNFNGQLGHNSSTSSSTPVRVNGLSGATAIAAGYTHSVALRSDGTVWSWGYNGFGQLGNNSLAESWVPVQAAGLTSVGAIAAGYHHSLAVRADGTVRAWGLNDHGQLGNNTTINAAAPLAVTALSGVSSVSAGGYHSMALTTDGSVKSWGWNAYGQLGDGTTNERHTPGAASAPAGVKGLVSGPVHAIALKADDGASAWGYNGLGELGDGTTNSSTVPVTVAGYSRGSAPLARYGYDGDGLRRSKTVAGVVTPFTWDYSGGLPLLIDDGTNFYIYGPGGVPLEHIDRSNTVTWYHQDQLGSTRVLSNGTGATVATATYDPYGRLLASSGKSSPLGFAGEYTDAETGFVYLRARHHDPVTGQFVSRDPLTDVTASPYAYVNGNPINFTDPSGLWGIRLGPIRVGNDGCLLGTKGDGSCRGTGAVDMIGGPVGTAGRCVMDPITCIDNAKVALAPLVLAGMSLTVAYGIYAACTLGPVGCVVALVILGPKVLGGAYATWKLMELLWFGKDHDRFYHALGGHKAHTEVTPC
ncbi:MAG: RHS repeat-associated core domain-containing protein [Acidimicrobiales bacterium]